MASAQRKSSPTPSLALEDFLPYRLSELSNRISRAIADRYAKTFNLTIPEWRVVAVLAQRPNLTAKQIVEATEMDKVAVSRAVARLSAAKRVAARLDPQDARRQLLALTATGAALHARIAPIALETEYALLAALKPEERRQLDAILDQLLDAARRL